LTVKTWETSDIPEEKFTTKQAVQDSIEEYYGSNLSGCEADKFQVMAGGVMCWGGYVIIGVVVGLVVVIAIIVGVSIPLLLLIYVPYLQLLSLVIPYNMYC